MLQGWFYEGLYSAGLGGNQNWRYVTVVARLVEVLQVQGVVPDLINGMCGEFLFTNFKLKDENDRTNQ